LIQFKKDTRQPTADIYVILQEKLTLSLFYRELTIPQTYLIILI